jgi:hypothetical protein
MRPSWLIYYVFVLGSACLLSCSLREPGDAVNLSATNQPTRSVSPTPAPEPETTVSLEVLARRLKLPKPEEYPTAKVERFTGTPAAAKITGKRAKIYRTVISEGAKAGPNFAGHYTVVTWGAGLGCFSIAIVDARDGRVLFMPFDGVGHARYGLNFDGRDEMNPAFRIDSKLIVFSGCPGKEYEGCTDWDKEGVYIYSFEKENFKLLRFVKRADFEAALKD